ncbi:unnamed protein product [Leptidea sinapis]|uniref:Tubulin--tyrosine ligase-like protein 12 SET-like domain-containing protein n=1 Tax=Leptidea sinapis TaxID=189913 RepID=A0A5E4QDC6_9NEOP|nr:unnamed protein product [Leptidea sinapis]
MELLAWSFTHWTSADIYLLSGVPENFWHTLCKKLNNQIFESGLSFQLVQIDYEHEEKHMILCELSLQNVPGLLQRMCNLMGITCNFVVEQIDEISKQLWKYTNTYSVAGNELSTKDRVPVWYIMDE